MIAWNLFSFLCILTVDVGWAIRMTSVAFDCDEGWRPTADYYSLGVQLDNYRLPTRQDCSVHCSGSPNCESFHVIRSDLISAAGATNTPTFDCWIVPRELMEAAKSRWQKCANATGSICTKNVTSERNLDTGTISSVSMESTFNYPSTASIDSITQTHLTPRLTTQLLIASSSGSTITDIDHISPDMENSSETNIDSSTSPDLENHVAPTGIDTALTTKSTSISEVMSTTQITPTTEATSITQTTLISETTAAAKIMPTTDTTTDKTKLTTDATLTAKTAPTTDTTLTAKTAPTTDTTLTAKITSTTDTTLTAKTMSTTDTTPTAKTAPTTDTTLTAKTMSTTDTTLTAKTAPTTDTTLTAKTMSTAKTSFTSKTATSNTFTPTYRWDNSTFYPSFNNDSWFYDMFNRGSNASSTGPTSATTAPRYDTDKFSAHYNELIWSDASDVCAQNNSRLVLINSTDKMDFVCEQFIGFSNKCFWINAMRIDENNPWRATTGYPLDLNLINSYLDNSLATSAYPLVICAKVKSRSVSGNATVVWNAQGDDTDLGPFICEKP